MGWMRWRNNPYRKVPNSSIIQIIVCHIHKKMTFFFVMFTFRDSVIIIPQFNPPSYLLEMVCITVKAVTSVKFTIVSAYSKILLDEEV